ncbi:MAG: hypothetical protein ACJAYF_003504 [Arenicella sp.]|jgi:hypothetical protein
MKITIEPQKVTPMSILNNALVIGAPAELHLIASGVVVQIISTRTNDMGIAKVEKLNSSLVLTSGFIIWISVRMV